MREQSTITTAGSATKSIDIPREMLERLIEEFGLRELARAANCAQDLERLEDSVEEISQRIHGGLMALLLQAVIDSPGVSEAAAEVVAATPRRMRSDGRVLVNVRTAHGGVVEVRVEYFRERSQARGRRRRRRRRGRRPGLYPALIVLGIWDRCTPRLASVISRSVGMLGSLEEAKTYLDDTGTTLNVKTIRTVAYRYAERARAAQLTGKFQFSETAAGKRVVISFDGGRVRVRRKKRGPKTKKGRSRFHADWREPKLLILYVVGDDGKPLRMWMPIIDGNLKGPDAVFNLILVYARQVGLTSADTVLFVADGAPWIWNRVPALIQALGLRPDQVFQLIDFYHAVEHLWKAAKLRSWKKGQRERWLCKQRRLLRRGEINSVIAALKDICRGRYARKIGTHIRYFTKNCLRFAYPKLHDLKLPLGSGAVESAIRRVLNLRIKGPSIYWLPENVDKILLRAYYKSNRWNDLERLATSFHSAAL